MGLLARSMMIGSLAAAGCYEPELRDCTLACSTETDCAAGQVCGADKFCATPELAGRCFERPARPDGGIDVDDPDGGTTQTDAGMQTMVDAGTATPPPDAPPSYVVVRVKVDGRGEIELQNHGTCDSDCVFHVPRAALVTARAFPDGGWRFEEWKTSTCPFSSVSTCTFSAIGDTTDVQGKFRKGDDDDDDGDDD